MVYPLPQPAMVPPLLVLLFSHLEPPLLPQGLFPQPQEV